MADSSTGIIEIERSGHLNHPTNSIHPISRELSPVFENREMIIKEEKINIKEEQGLEVQNNIQQTSLSGGGSIDEENNGHMRPNNHNFIGRLVSKDNILLISENVIEIGRNSSTSRVNFHVCNIFVSRKHLKIVHNNGEFYMVCLSKNGVFVDGVFTRKSGESVKLPKM